MMAQKDPAAAAAQRYKPIQSAVPGTTLGPIQIDAFLGGGVYAIFIFVFFHHKCSFSFGRFFFLIFIPPVLNPILVSVHWFLLT